MDTPRWILPFTWGVNMHAIEHAVRLAESAGATLVPISLLTAPAEGARLEHIQQSKDFLEAVSYKAKRYQLPVERYEVLTTDVRQSIKTLVHDLHCDGIILITSNKQTCLLQNEEIKYLLVEPPAPIVLLRLPPAREVSAAPQLQSRLLSQVRRLWKWQKGGDLDGWSTYLTGRR